MRLVTEWAQVENNLIKLDQYRHSSDTEEVKFYIDLIKRGICFVVYEQRGNLLFGPSRFVGYVDNNSQFHQTNESKDGRKTNTVITNILNHPPEEDETLEKDYEKLCDSLGIEPSKTGVFGVKRKYWFRSMNKT